MTRHVRAEQWAKLTKLADSSSADLRSSVPLRENFLSNTIFPGPSQSEQVRRSGRLQHMQWTVTNTAHVEEGVWIKVEIA
jgi:hypothetical protein